MGKKYSFFIKDAQKPIHLTDIGDIKSMKKIEEELNKLLLSKADIVAFRTKNDVLIVRPNSLDGVLAQEYNTLDINDENTENNNDVSNAPLIINEPFSKKTNKRSKTNNENVSVQLHNIEENKEISIDDELSNIMNEDDDDNFEDDENNINQNTIHNKPLRLPNKQNIPFDSIIHDIENDDSIEQNDESNDAIGDEDNIVHTNDTYNSSPYNMDEEENTRKSLEVINTPVSDNSEMLQYTNNGLKINLPKLEDKLNNNVEVFDDMNKALREAQALNNTELPKQKTFPKSKK